MSAGYGVQVVYGALPRAIMDSSPEIVRLSRVAAIRAALPFLQRKLALATPSNFGLLRGSVTPEMGLTMGAEPVGFVGYAGAPSLYAGVVETGSTKHWWPPGRYGAKDPLAPLTIWAARKFGYPAYSSEARRAGYLVARKISRKGLAGAHMVENTVHLHGGQAQDLMRAAALEAFNSIGR